MNKKVVVGVSGGPDSMYLLYKLYKKNRVTPVVAHVNYNFREESVKETELVRNFCKQNNIELYVLEVTEELLKEYAQYNNKQQMARIIRYDFYKDVANKVKAKDIYLAHHKDDFIETAIMQEEKSKDLPFYGIDKVKTYEGFTIKRPLLKYWKSDILEKCEKKNIPYLHDKSNFETKYKRNQIRSKLSTLPLKKKKKIAKHYEMINKSNESLRNTLDKKWNEFESSNFNRRYLLEQKEDIQYHLMYRFLINTDEHIKINKNKVLGALEFVKTHKGKSYRLMEDVQLIVKDSKIKVYKK